MLTTAPTNLAKAAGEVEHTGYYLHYLQSCAVLKVGLDFRAPRPS